MQEEIIVLFVECYRLSRIFDLCAVRHIEILINYAATWYFLAVVVFGRKVELLHLDFKQWNLAIEIRGTM